MAKRHTIHEIPDEAALPPLPWTQRQAAEQWGVSYTTVRRWLYQDRLKADKHATVWLIWQIERPRPVAPGELKPEQRGVWGRGQRREQRARWRARRAKR